MNGEHRLLYCIPHASDDGKSGRRAFTLIELLITITIMATLFGMLMPIVTMAGRESRKSATRSVMVKVDTALRLFRADLGPYPYQISYADLAAGDPWTNRLYYHLGTDLADADRAKMVADGDAAAALYVDGSDSNPFPTPVSYSARDVSFNYSVGWGVAYFANRMARERVRLAIYSGHAFITSGVLKIPYTHWRNGSTPFPRRVLPTTPLLAAPTSAAKPGWAKDYLVGEIPARYISGDAILDAWKRPLIYVCQVVEGMFSAPGAGGNELNALDMGLQPLGRRSLAPTDKITGKPLVADAAYLPDLSNLRHSDRRFYAPVGMELEFELWSAGPDGRAAWMRDAVENTDNLPLQNYDKGIP
jgi:prepilin-type N-terminal cleavage/methylation domain-containing protein